MPKIDKKILQETIRTTLFNQFMCFGWMLITLIKADYLSLYVCVVVYLIGMFYAYQRQSNKF